MSLIKKDLTPEQRFVLLGKGTEPPFSGKYLKPAENGIYVCAACDYPIFESEAQFDSGCGWPAFDRAIPDHVCLSKDTSHGLNRTEVTCARCGSHLGHVFNDGPSPTGQRFCINSVAMELKAHLNLK